MVVVGRPGRGDTCSFLGLGLAGISLSIAISVPVLSRAYDANIVVMPRELILQGGRGETRVRISRGETGVRVCVCAVEGKRGAY